MWMQRMERWEKYGKAHTNKPSLLVHTQGEISRQTNRQKVLPDCSLLLINMMNTTPPGFTGNQKQVIADLTCSRLTRHSSCRKWGHRSSPSRMEALGGKKRAATVRQQKWRACLSNELAAPYWSWMRRLWAWIILHVCLLSGIILPLVFLKAVWCH